MSFLDFKAQGEKMSQERGQVEKKDCWNVESLYASFEDWEKDFEQVAGLNKTKGETSSRWPEILQFKGKLHGGASTVKQMLESVFSVERKLEFLYTYAHLRHDEDLAEDQHKQGYQRVLNLVQEFSKETSWISPEILALSNETLNLYLESEELKSYRFYLEKIVHLKPHTLDKEKEELVALAQQSQQSAHKAFSAMNNADFVFGKVKNSEGEELELTHASYGLFIRDTDRELRKNSFMTLHGKFGEFQNTLCELNSGQVQSHLFNARARNYSSCLEAALYPKNINTSVYRSLIDSVHKNIGSHHRYIQLRKRVLGLSELHYYDTMVPLLDEMDMKIDYERGEELVIESVAPLGKEYQDLLRKGLKEERWVDRYENKGKRSGAYSSGCYDSYPFILMNYKGVLRDLFTLAHEAGHSMHSLLSHKNQPYHDASYPIFVAEVASTFNEELLMRKMLAETESAEQKAFLLNEKIEDIRATLFRQTMFAEFELFMHEMAEKNSPLTPSVLKEKYLDLVRFYFGDALTVDDELGVEWARIPHFYYNFYVYQYATGVSAALALSEKVIAGDEKARESYLKFISSGGSQYPIDLLKCAGVDMCSPEPVEMAIGKFHKLVEELEGLLVTFS